MEISIEFSKDNLVYYAEFDVDTKLVDGKDKLKEIYKPSFGIDAIDNSGENVYISQLERKELFHYVSNNLVDLIQKEIDNV